MTFDRRAFLKTVSASAAYSITGSIAASAAMTNPRQDPIQTASSPLFNLALAAYSFKPHFAFYKGKVKKPAGGKSINMFEFIDYCAEQSCGAELTSYFFPPDADEAYFQKIKRHAFHNGVPIVGTAIGNNFTIPKGEKLDKQIADAKLWIDRAVQMGAPHIRFFAGKKKQLEESPETMAIAIESLRECVDYAEKAGVFIGVENHGGLTAADVIQIIKAIDSDWFGVNLDSGNFVTGDPYEELVKCAPYAINVQIKVKMKSLDGEKYEADLDRVAKIFHDANYRGNVVLEYEGESPFEKVPGAMDQMRKLFPTK